MMPLICNNIIDRLNLAGYERNLFPTNTNYDEDNRLEFFCLQAKNLNADYFYCYNNSLEENIVPFIYVYDQQNTTRQNSSIDVVKTNKQLWTLGEVALAVIVYIDEIVIIDTRKHIEIKDNKENAAILYEVQQIDIELKKRIFEGRILEEQTNYKDISPYELLLKHIKDHILDSNKREQINCSNELLRKVLIKFIFIKYLEEQIDINGISVFSDTFFNKYIPDSKLNNPNFCDVILYGNVIPLLRDLSSKFNGGIFALSEEEEVELSKANLSIVASALDGRADLKGQLNFWRYYDFNLLPIEFISRLYESFIISTNEKSQKNTGAYYTPPHLARLLIDEVLPFDKHIDFKKFKLLDPTCGSGVFLALAYKRLITLWLLSNKKTGISGIEDIKAIKNILTKCIYGVDINIDALAITATSLQIELCSHIQPKEIWENLQFDNLTERGNLTRLGFFKWYKTITATNKFDIIVGNPPFNLSEKENKENVNNGIDEEFRLETYDDCENRFKKKTFPSQNPALIILFKTLQFLLKDQGELFMIMPASSFLYMASSSNYKRNIAYKWNIRRIYDFTPLRTHLWGTTNVATVAVKIDNKFQPDSYNIEHIVVRNSFANEKGAIHFLIDKYDRYNVPIDFMFSDIKKHIWKINLLGGGRLEYFVEGLTEFTNIKLFFSNNKINYNTGFHVEKKFIQKSLDKLANDPTVQIDNFKHIKEEKQVNSKLFSWESIENDSIPLLTDNNKKDYARIPHEVQQPPNVWILLNNNKRLPIVYNENENLYFPTSFLGIKGENEKLLQQFTDCFKENVNLYSLLIKIYSSQNYIAQTGAYTVKVQELEELPINLDNQGKPIAFELFNREDTAIIEDTELIATNLMKANSLLYNKIKINTIIQYEDIFCDILNLIYENGSYKFRTIRRIISDDFVWVTFQHTTTNKTIENSLGDTNKDVFNKIIYDNTNEAIVINRIIISYDEANCISFIKPNKLKYWMQTIAYRDAEDVKSAMFLNGY